MKKFIKIIILALCLLVVIKSNSQVVINSQCPNTDFSLQNFTNWAGCYCTSGSSCYTPVMNSGTIPNCTPLATPPSINCGTPGFLTPTSPGVSIARPPLHTILTTANTSYYNGSSPSLTGLYDSLTNYGLRKIPVGINQVVRLNSWKTMYETSQLIYTITVDTNVSGLFVYSYAAVLQNPSHGCADQPYFQIRLLNANGQPISNQCGSFTFVAGTPGAFINHTTVGSLGNIDWFNWQTVGLNLKPYHGQTVKIQAIAADCNAGGHFGYGYFYGYCVPNKIDISYCPGSTTATLTAPSGFKYKWIPSGDTTQTITIIAPQDSSVYQVVIKSLFNPNCADTLRTILIPNIIHSNFTFTNQCVGVPVNFNRTTTSNVNIYNWAWNFGDPGTLGNTMNFINSPSHTYYTPGNYTVTLIDSLQSGCPDTIQKVITVFPNPNIVTVGDSVCLGDSAFISASGASTYMWSNGVSGASQTLFTSAADTIYVIATTSNGCVDSSFAYVHIYDKPSISFIADTMVGCEPIQTNFTNLTEPSSSTYLWSFGDNTTSTQLNPSHTYSAGVYNVSLQATTPEGCKDIASIPNLINVYNMPHPSFSWNPPVGLLNFPVTFANLTQPTTNNPFTYDWRFGDNVSDMLGIAYGNVGHVYASQGHFDVSLVAYNIISPSKSCVDSIKFTILIVNDSLTLPNIITPNGDGKNDKFVIKGLNSDAYPETLLLIFNRWGKKIYESENYKNDFDGEGLPDGTYYYVFKGKGIIKEVELKGSLTILR